MNEPKPFWGAAPVIVPANVQGCPILTDYNTLFTGLQAYPVFKDLQGKFLAKKEIREVISSIRRRLLFVGMDFDIEMLFVGPKESFLLFDEYPFIETKESNDPSATLFTFSAGGNDLIIPDRDSFLQNPGEIDIKVSWTQAIFINVGVGKGIGAHVPRLANWSPKSIGRVRFPSPLL